MSLRRSAALGVVLLTAVLLQVTLLPLLSGGGFVPDLVVVVLVVLTLEAGPRAALWAAGSTGLLVNLLAVSVPLGSSIIVYATCVVILILLRLYLAEREDLMTAVLAGAVAATSMAAHGGIRMLLTDQPTFPASTVAWGALIVGAFAVLLAPAVLVVVRRVLAATDVAGTELVG